MGASCAEKEKKSSCIQEDIQKNEYVSTIAVQHVGTRGSSGPIPKFRGRQQHGKRSFIQNLRILKMHT